MNKTLYYPSEGESWANIIEKGEDGRARRRSRSRSRSRSPSPRRRSVPKNPERGNIRMNNDGRMMIYSRKGKWVPAVNEYSNYGGPYSNIEELQRNPRYMSNIANIFGDEKAAKAERTAARVGAESGKKKVMQPCKFLYSCKGTPAKPTTRKVSSECWSFEYTDPVTGEVKKPRVCDRMHPGEPGWRSEWNGNPSFSPKGGSRRMRATRRR